MISFVLRYAFILIKDQVVFTDTILPNMTEVVFNADVNYTLMNLPHCSQEENVRIQFMSYTLKTQNMNNSSRILTFLPNVLSFISPYRVHFVRLNPYKKKGKLIIIDCSKLQEIFFCFTFTLLPLL